MNLVAKNKGENDHFWRIFRIFQGGKFPPQGVSEGGNFPPKFPFSPPVGKKNTDVEGGTIICIRVR